MKYLILVFIGFLSFQCLAQRTLIANKIKGLDRIEWSDGNVTIGVSNDSTFTGADSLKLVTEWALRNYFNNHSSGGGNQNLNYTGGTGLLAISGGNNVTIKVSEQTVKETFFNLTTSNTVTVITAFPSNLNGVSIFRNGVFQEIGLGLDCSISGQIVTFNHRDFQDNEKVVIVQTK